MTQLPPGANPRLHDFGRWLGRVLYRPFYRISYRGTENIPPSGPLVVVANHSTMIEPQLVFGLLRRRIVFLVKHEMFGGVAGKGLRAIGQLPVRRGEPDRTPLLEAVRLLKSGGAVGIFPEGTRGSGDVDSAEQGAAWLARAANATVVAVAVRGTLRPPGARRRLRPRVDVLVGQPFTPRIGKGKAGLAEGTEVIRDQLAQLVRTLDATREERKRT